MKARSLLLVALMAAGCSGPVSPPHVARAVGHAIRNAVSSGKHVAHHDPLCPVLGRHQLAENAINPHRGPDNEQLLTTLPVRTPRVLVPGHPAYRWTPPTPLPDPSPGRPVVIVYSPHPDDETLSMGALIAHAVARGDRVIAVALTDGMESSALGHIDSRLTLSGGHPLDRTQLGDARIAEMRQALVALGVAPSDIYRAHLDALDSDCGAQVTVTEAEQVEQAFAARFPDATHVTMSFAAERQPDHLAAGEALRVLHAEGVVRKAQWAVSRLWWELPMPSCAWVGADGLRARIQAAERAYTTWDPSKGEYAIGYQSVPSQFDAMKADPRNLMHGSGPALSSCAPRRV